MNLTDACWHERVHVEHVDWRARPGVTPPPAEQLPLMGAL